MCNYGCFSVKPLSEKNLATYGLYIKKLLYERKGTQIASMKCGSLKRRIGESKFSFVSFVSIKKLF